MRPRKTHLYRGRTRRHQLPSLSKNIGHLAFAAVLKCGSSPKRRQIVSCSHRQTPRCPFWILSRWCLLPTCAPSRAVWGPSVRQRHQLRCTQAPRLQVARACGRVNSVRFLEGVGCFCAPRKWWLRTVFSCPAQETKTTNTIKHAGNWKGRLDDDMLPCGFSEWLQSETPCHTSIKTK